MFALALKLKLRITISRQVLNLESDDPYKLVDIDHIIRGHSFFAFAFFVICSGFSAYLAYHLQGINFSAVLMFLLGVLSCILVYFVRNTKNISYALKFEFTSVSIVLQPQKSEVIKQNTMPTYTYQIHYENSLLCMFGIFLQVHRVTDEDCNRVCSRYAPQKLMIFISPMYLDNEYYKKICRAIIWSDACHNNK